MMCHVHGSWRTHRLRYQTVDGEDEAGGMSRMTLKVEVGLGLLGMEDEKRALVWMCAPMGGAARQAGPLGMRPPRPPCR